MARIANATTLSNGVPVEYVSRQPFGRLPKIPITKDFQMKAYRSASTRVYAGAVAGLCVFTSIPAACAAELSADSDVIGLRTTMTRDQVKQVIQQQFGTTDFPAQKLKFGTSDYSRELTLSFTADVTSSENKAAYQQKLDEANAANKQNIAAGCSSPLCRVVVSGTPIKETVEIDIDPTDGSTAVFAINRQTDYPESKQVLEQVFLQSLLEKYGKPIVSYGGGQIYWVNPGVQIGQQLRECSTFAELVGSLPGQLSTLMNMMGNGPMTMNGRNKLKPPPCSMYLKATIITVTHPGTTGDHTTKYVSGLRMTLVNVRSSYDALSRFANEFWAAADGARQKAISVQSQNKPKL